MPEMLIPPELQELILQHVTHNDRQTLLYFALSCQSFKETALGALWKSMSSLEPLIRTMSERGDLWDLKKRRSQRRRGTHTSTSLYESDSENSGPSSSESSDESDDSEDESSADLIFIRGIEERDWTRLHYYGARIRHLQLYSAIGVEPKILRELAAYRPAQQIFQKIESFKIWLEWKLIRNSAYLVPILGPSLVKLTINVCVSRYDTRRLRSLLHGWARLCPTVRHFSLEFMYPTSIPENTTSIESTIAQWKALESFHLQGLRMTPGIFYQLGKLKHFLHCDLGLASQPGVIFLNSTTRWISQQNDQFPVMETFRVHNESDWRPLLPTVCTSGSAMKVFEAIGEYDVAGHMFLPASFCDLFFRTISKNTSLHTLTLESSMPTRTKRCSSEGGTIPGAIFHLLNLQGLTTVRISSPVLKEADDSFLLHLSQSWKVVTSLTLTFPHRSREFDDDAMKMTSQGLLPIFENCPRLRALSISCICTPYNAAIIKGCQPNKKIRDLAFVRSRLLGDPSTLAQQLRELLPKSKPYHSMDYLDDEQMDLWKRFKRAVRG